MAAEPGPKAMHAARIAGAIRRVPVWSVYALGSLPILLLGVEAATRGLGADPVKRIEHALGLAALQFLLAGLAVTPILRFWGVNLIRFRRALGLLAFGHAALHVAVWMMLDLQLRWSEIAADLTRRPYIVAGMVAFMLLIPLAATSNDSALRRLGALRWRRLHRLVYPAVLLAGVHHLLSFKVWTVESVAYFSVGAGLLALRLVPVAGRRQSWREEK
jgi:sulfoxide reductase heme-binding subunit YedZ